jgi:hypothetical protein
MRNEFVTRSDRAIRHAEGSDRKNSNALAPSVLIALSTGCSEYFLRCGLIHSTLELIRGLYQKKSSPA